MRLILVRHGETACNLKNIWHGWDECALTERGREQAESVSRRLAGEPIDAVYSSPSRRALETARAIAEPHGLEPIADEGLRERNAGQFEGIDVEEVSTRHPSWEQERNADFWGWHPPEGETFRDVLKRTLEAVDRIHARHPDDTVVIATHMGPVRLLISRLAGISLEDTYTMPFPSTGVSIFDLDGNGHARVEVLNDAEHVL